MTTDSFFSSPPPRRWGVGLCVGLLAVALVLAGCDSDDGGMGDPPPETAPTTLTDVVTDTDDLSTLATALGAANRADALDDTSETYTVFAPSNLAFGFYDVDFLTSNTDLLGSVLDYHVVSGAAVTSDQLSDGDTFTTVQGDEIEVTIEDGDVFVEGAPVTMADVEADNGVAHIVGDVLLTNRTAGERLQVTNATEALFQAVDDAGLTSAFNNPDNVWTTFAPNNQAFENADLGLFTDEEIGQILQYHTVPDTVDSDLLLQQLSSSSNGEISVTTNQGGDLTITQVAPDSIVFNGGEAALNLDRVDQRASNGVIHPIDGLLTPPSIQATLADLVANTEDLSTLATALGATGQDQALDNPDETYTVFAPSNPAFGPYDVDFLVDNTQLLSEVLGYHVVQGAAVTSDQLSDGDTFTTLQGDEIEVTIEDGDVFVEGAPVTMPDLEVDNGVAHVVGDVLLTNRSPLERLQANTATQTLRQQLGNAGLASTFDSSVWTTFAPSNEAFQNADLGGFSESEIQEILQYHTLDGPTDAEALLQLLSDNNGEVSVTTNQGDDLTITQVEPDSIVFNGGQAALNLNRIDQRAGNGSIIHQIDGVLIPPSVMQSVSYDLEAQMNDGAISGGVDGTVTFWDAGQGQTIVTLELDDGATGASVAHPAHIHANSASEGGGIEIYLTPIDGSGGGGTSARLVERPFDELANFDGHVNIHESVANLGTVVSQGNIGANAQGNPAASLDLVGNQRSETYSLDANGNQGDIAPNGIPGTVTFLELTSGLTFVQVSLDTGNGATGASVGHPAHIHNNSASEGGGIQYYLSPVDGSDSEARSGKLVGESYDTLVGFDGHVNVHESVGNLGDIVSQGDVGSNAP